VNLPTPNEFAKDRGYNPFPPRWERWLSAAREGILSAQPVAGRHVSIDEHPGKGTVVNVEREIQPAAFVGECNSASATTCDYTVSADFYRTVPEGDNCCLPVEIHMSSEAEGEDVGFLPGSGFNPCDPRTGIKGGPGSAAPILTDCGSNLCYCRSIGDLQTWTYGSMTCQLVGNPNAVCAGPHGSVYCCPHETSITGVSCGADGDPPPPPGETCVPVPCVGAPVDILNTEIIGEPGVHLIDFINPKAFLNIFRDMTTGNYTVIPTGYVMDRDGVATTYCYNPAWNSSAPFLFAICCLDYCRLGYEPIVLGPSLAGNSYDITASIDVNGLIMSPDCWGGALDGFCLEGFCGCCGLSGTIDFSWHVDFH
jgi:hypothetical protein